MPQASKKAPHIVEGKRKPSGFPNTIPPPALPGSGYRVWSRGLPLSRPYASTPLFDLLRPEPPSVFGQQQHTAFPPFCQPLSNIGRKIPSLVAFANFSLDIFPPGAYNQYALSREPFAPVAQLDSVFGYEPKGQGFESLLARQKRRLFRPSLFYLPFKHGRETRSPGHVYIKVVLQDTSHRTEISKSPVTIIIVMHAVNNDTSRI